jgi:glucan biosynthesis protein C
VYVLIDLVIGMAASAICYMIIKRSRIASMLFDLKPKAKKIAVPLEARM